MNIISPSFEILSPVQPDAMLESIERCGRICYRSEHVIAPGSAKKFVKMIISNGHESVLEHEKITVRIVCDRGVTHEIVRHRIASYSQESTRYCNYSKDRFGGITFIRPYFFESEPERFAVWQDAMASCENAYLKLLELGATPEEARTVLPNSLKTEIIVTMNLREWRHFFRLRAGKRAHPQMREVAVPLLRRFCELLPEVFEDVLESI